MSAIPRVVPARARVLASRSASTTSPSRTLSLFRRLGTTTKNATTTTTTTTRALERGNDDEETLEARRRSNGGLAYSASASATPTAGDYETALRAAIEEEAYEEAARLRDIIRTIEGDSKRACEDANERFYRAFRAADVDLQRRLALPRVALGEADIFFERSLWDLCKNFQDQFIDFHVDPTLRNDAIAQALVRVGGDDLVGFVAAVDLGARAAVLDGRAPEDGALGARRGAGSARVDWLLSRPPLSGIGAQRCLGAR